MPANSNSRLTETSMHQHNNPASTDVSTSSPNPQPHITAGKLTYLVTPPPICLPNFPTPEIPRLAHAAPDVLDEPVTLGQPVERVVALAHRPDEPAERVDDVLALDRAAVLVNRRDRDLDRGVVLGLDDAVRGAALARDVAEGTELANPSSFREVEASGRGGVQVDDFSLVVFHFGGGFGGWLDGEGFLLVKL